MNHGNKLNHLGRKSAHRKALLRNLTISLIMHKRITTTEAKAKALRVFAEPLFTKSKDDSTHNRRVIFGYLQNKEALIELFSTVAPAIANRPGGYLRIVKLGFRKGDAADIAIIELVDFNEVYKIKSDTSKSSGRRGRRGKGSAANTDSSAVVEDAVLDSDNAPELENKD
ncbi:MAG: 50S ribosomal protein L17 [Bacteroidota bacterium]|jgi:large subunit ribosomal protein L17